MKKLHAGTAAHASEQACKLACAPRSTEEARQSELDLMVTNEVVAESTDESLANTSAGRNDNVFMAKVSNQRKRARGRQSVFQYPIHCSGPSDDPSDYW